MMQALCSTSILAVPAQQVSLASKAISLLVFALGSDTDLTDSTSCNATLLNSQVLPCSALKGTTMSRSMLLGMLAFPIFQTACLFSSDNYAPA